MFRPRGDRIKTRIAEIPQRLSDEAMLSFCYDHGASFDWIILGDVKGRLRQARHGRGWQREA
jgi:hypothetical protein